MHGNRGAGRSDRRLRWIASPLHSTSIPTRVICALQRSWLVLSSVRRFGDHMASESE